MGDDGAFGQGGGPRRPGPDGPRRSRPDRLRLALVAGAVLLVGGTAAAVLSVRWGMASFGWFAYAPLTEEVYAPPVLVLGPGLGWGVAAGAVGLALVSGAVGYGLGRRRPPRSPARPR